MEPPDAIEPGLGHPGAGGLDLRQERIGGAPGPGGAGGLGFDRHSLPWSRGHSSGHSQRPQLDSRARAGLATGSNGSATIPRTQKRDGSIPSDNRVSGVACAIDSLITGTSAPAGVRMYEVVIDLSNRF
jgi:hypothetical protein